MRGQNFLLAAATGACARRIAGMRARIQLGVLVAVVLTVAGSILLPGLGGAQPATCPAPGENAATVTIDAPEADAEVGGRIEVTGQAEGPEPLFQVELFVGDSRKDFVVFDPPVPAGEFTLVWDATTVGPGPATLLVVTCGGTIGPGNLIRGAAAVDVQVQPPAPGTTVVLAEVEDEDDGRRPRSSLVAGAAIAIPAAVGLVYAMGRRRSS